MQSIWPSLRLKRTLLQIGCSSDFVQLIPILTVTFLIFPYHSTKWPSFCTLRVSGVTQQIFVIPLFKVLEISPVNPNYHVFFGSTSNNICSNPYFPFTICLYFPNTSVPRLIHAPSIGGPVKFTTKDADDARPVREGSKSSDAGKPWEPCTRGWRCPWSWANTSTDVFIQRRHVTVLTTLIGLRLPPAPAFGRLECRLTTTIRLKLQLHSTLLEL